MHFILSSMSFLLMLMTFVQSAPTTSLDAATLLKNAQEAQKLNAQFQSANSTPTGSCTNGDTTCVKDAIATCVNGQFATSNGCPTTQQCFALPSVKSNGTIIACTSEKSAQSLINAAGATGDVTGSGSKASNSSINPAAASPTSSGSNSAAAAAETAVSMDADCITTPTASTPTTGPSESVVTVTVTLTPSIPTTLPPVTKTLSPEQASSSLSSLLAQGGPAATAEPDCSDAPSEALTSAFSASATDILPATVIPSTAAQSAASKILSSASTAATIANNAGAGSQASSVSGYGAGGYNGY